MEREVERKEGSGKKKGGREKEGRKRKKGVRICKTCLLQCYIFVDLAKKQIKISSTL